MSWINITQHRMRDRVQYVAGERKKTEFFFMMMKNLLNFTTTTHQYNLHATLIRLLSSSAPFENHGFDDLHVNSAPSFSAETRNVNILAVRFESTPSLFTVTSAWRIGSPSMSHVTFAGGYEPHVSHRIGSGRPAVSNSFGVTIFTLIGFTERRLRKWNWI